MTIVQKTSISIVSTQNCSELAGTKDPFILMLKQGQNLFEAILDCAKTMGLTSASLQGLGALDDVTVAYYNLNTKQYQTKLFTGMYELISLHGNISMVEEQPFLHIHGALGQEDYSVVGGHFMEATVGPTAEITVIPFASPIHRKFNEETGLKLMCPFGNKR